MRLYPFSVPLFTDLYELTMAAGYFDHCLCANATFSVFVREDPHRHYWVAAGLADLLHALEDFSFSREDLAYLKEIGLFSDAFLECLRDLRFTGSVHAMPEGSLFFANEPVLEITAPLVEAQIIETFVLNTIQFQTMIASKAARCMHAARGRGLVDFSLRRTQGEDAGMKVARNTWLVGFAGTSNVLAGKVYGIPVSGTMAHSFVTAFDSEIEAFRAFADTYPNHSVFLIDTYDVPEGARNAVRVATEMRHRGEKLLGVRLDSGDMTAQSIEVRRILDEVGFPDVKIFASSGYDEFKIDRAVGDGARIDAFGVGTKVGVSADRPYMDIVYKLVRFNGRDVCKFSPGKITLAGKKQVFRKQDDDGRLQNDVIGLRDEVMPDRTPLLEPVMENGRIVRSLPELETIRNRFAENFAQLDDTYKQLESGAVYPVDVSERLQAIQPS
jgi:nicotinate phosphoribosyltransferase